MRNHGRFLLRGGPALAALLAACGCSLPGTFGVSSEPTPSPTKTGTPHPLVAPAASANSVAPVTGPGPAPVMPLNLAGPESPQDVISLQAQQLHAAEADHNALAVRILQLEGLLQEKETAMGEVTEEVRKSTEEVSRKRLEIQRLKQDNADLLEKLRKRDEEVIELRKQIIKLMEKEPPAPPKEPMPGKEP